jgi:hypothetical protein
VEEWERTNVFFVNQINAEKISWCNECLYFSYVFFFVCLILSYISVIFGNFYDGKRDKKIVFFRVIFCLESLLLNENRLFGDSAQSLPCFLKC